MILLRILTLLFICEIVYSDRTSQKIYVNVKGISACFRRLNGTHQIGCNSARGGNTGVLHYIETGADADWLVNKGPNKPYVALLTAETFTRPIVMQLADSGKISGMLVIHSDESEAPMDFSPDKPCPNDMWSRYKDDPLYAHCKNVTWNPKANSLFYEDFAFPILAVTNSTEVNEGLIERCYNRYNKPTDTDQPRPYPLCSAQVKVAMDAAKDTPTCIRRSRLQNNLNPQVYCDPLEYYSVYGFVHPINDSKSTQDHRVIVASARMDSFSMFEDIYPSADSAVTGIVTLLAAASAIGKVKNSIDPNIHKPIMFTFLNGEAFDYIGSQRVAYDMLEGKFPWNASDRASGPPLLKPSNIEQFVEVSQVGLTDGGATWMHTDPRVQGVGDKMETLLDLLQNQSTEAGLTLSEASKLQPLPAASYQTFLQEANISGVVIADHQKAFTNKYYNSRFDTAEVIGHEYPDGEENPYDYVTDAAKHLTKIALTLARTLYSLSTGEQDASAVELSELEVAHLLYCFLNNSKCDLFNETMSSSYYNRIPVNTSLNYYVGVAIGDGSNQPVYPIRQLLGYFLSNNATDAVNKSECDKKSSMLYEYTWINGPVNETSMNQSRIGRCIESTANLTKAKSPAFDIDDYDWSSNKYSSWTESRWAGDAISLRVFLIPSKEQEVTTLCVGIGMLLSSFGAIFFLTKRAPMIFDGE